MFFAMLSLFVIVHIVFDSIWNSSTVATIIHAINSKFFTSFDFFSIFSITIFVYAIIIFMKLLSINLSNIFEAFSIILLDWL
jgi:hypothetical protein